MPNIDMTADELRRSADIVRKACPDKKLAAEVHAADADGKVITTFYCGPTDKSNNNLKDILSVWDYLSGTTS